MKLAFVPPRFGPGVLGGAEAVCREAAFGLAARGHDVEVITTCAIDHYTWENELPEGISEEDGVVVRRFPVLRHHSRAALKAQLSIHAGKIPDLDHQVSWLGFQFGAPALFEYILRYGRRTTRSSFPLTCSGRRAFVYLLWPSEPSSSRACTTSPTPAWTYCDQCWPTRRSSGSFPARSTCWPTARPGRRSHSVTGAGVPVPSRYDPAGFMERHRLERPFVLYAGRREEGKGTGMLLESFAAAVHDGGPDLDLVMHRQRRPRGDVSAFVSHGGTGYRPRLRQRRRTEQCLCRRNRLCSTEPDGEFFTHDHGGVAGRHARDRARRERGGRLALRRSGGGLMFSDTTNWQPSCTLSPPKPDVATEMAAAGRRYVVENYTVAHRARPHGGKLANRFMTARRALVVGSYPPVPGAAAAATVAAVRRAWDAGIEVVVVSPRPSAAPFVVPVAGTALGRELAKLRVEHACNEVVLCVEPGWPFAGHDRAGSYGARTARALAQALSGFERAELVVTGEIGVAPEALALLLPIAGPVTASSEEVASGLRAAGEPVVRVVDPFAGSGLRLLDDDAGKPQSRGAPRASGVPGGGAGPAVPRPRRPAVAR